MSKISPLPPAPSRPPVADETEVAPQAEPPFQLTSGWLLVGILALLVGLGSGLLMSSATFLK